MSYRKHPHVLRAAVARPKSVHIVITLIKISARLTTSPVANVLVKFCYIIEITVGLKVANCGIRLGWDLAILSLRLTGSVFLLDTTCLWFNFSAARASADWRMLVCVCRTSTMIRPAASCDLIRWTYNNMQCLRFNAKQTNSEIAIVVVVV